MNALDTLRAFVADCDRRRVPDAALVAEQVWSDSEPTIGQLRAVLTEREWQPIETAPRVLRDTGPFGIRGMFEALLVCEAGFTAIYLGFQRANDDTWYGAPNGTPLHFVPTHWMPKPPEPPKASGSDRDG